MIVLFTDFGWQGPYVGQMKAVLLQHAPQQAVIDLMHDAPAFNPKASAYLLNALCQQFPPGCVFLAVVDPGVGSPERRAVIVQADGQWFVGPDNGLFEIISRTAKEVKYWEITWRPKKISASFHGRDLFAPLAASIGSGNSIESFTQPITGLTFHDWPMALAEIIYIDHYGNAMTGLPAAALTINDHFLIGDKRVAFARTFAEMPIGEAFWYINSIGLIELAVNRGSFCMNFMCNIGLSLGIE
jgi:S-adenosyl-L-methionine hydrolase (adenosine-forming)